MQFAIALVAYCLVLGVALEPAIAAARDLIRFKLRKLV
jgi:hypothetical protein